MFNFVVGPASQVKCFSFFRTCFMPIMGTNYAGAIGLICMSGMYNGSYRLALLKIRN
jgi:hypothetical protein